MNVEALRRDFPLLTQPDPPRYFDSACMTLKPRQVIDAVVEYYERFPVCAGRSVYDLSQELGARINAGRDALARFLGAPPEGVVWTKNATEAVNLVAHSFPFQPGDVVLTTDREHNSNLVPWQMLKARGVRHEVLPSLPDGRFDLAGYRERLARGGVRLVSMVHVSNLDGFQIPARDVVQAAHAVGARVLLDGAQAAPHLPVNLRALDADFYTVSIHKMLGPTGVGALVTPRPEVLEELSPFLVGGDTVAGTTYEGPTFVQGRQRFEAGLQNFAGLVGVAPAVEYLERVGLEAVRRHDEEIARVLAKGLAAVPGLRLLGPPPESRSGCIVSFTHEAWGRDDRHGEKGLGRLGAHEVAILLNDKHRVLVRSGDHCVHSWLNAHEVPGAVRLSGYLYNTVEEAEAVVAAVEDLHRRLGG
ncbi:MAG TPA: aminotransferase class V-fold PLP-dependent enzyme [Candidatus Thermoplasmatota archaeon]|nr:aminotransferase class V-fold PLP-dependent enzyme [Candidatus Thermoplasmatota archaeon]